MDYKQCEGCETDVLNDIALYDVTFTNDEEKKVWYCLECADLSGRNFNGCTDAIQPATSHNNSSDGHTYWLGQGKYPSGEKVWMSAILNSDGSADMHSTFYVADYIIDEDDLDKLEKWLKALAQEKKMTPTDPKYDPYGQRMTDCCGGFSTYGTDVNLDNLDSVPLRCAVCGKLTTKGEGDQTEFRDGVTPEIWFERLQAHEALAQEKK